MPLIFDPLNPSGTGGGGPITFSAGLSSASLNSLVFSDGNGVSFGLNGSTITASVGAAGAGLTNIKVSAGTTSNLLSALTFNDQTVTNAVSFGLSGSVITGAVGAFLTTARGSTDAIGLNTAKSNVTWTVNSSGLSLDARGYAGTATAITGGSLTVNSDGVSLNLPAYLTTARRSTDAIGLNTAKTNVTWTVNSSGLSFDASGYAGTATAITGGSLTVNSDGVSLNLPAYLTTARRSTDAVGLNTAQTNVTWTVNSSGISINAGGYAGTNTAMTGGSVTLNSSGISINVATQTNQTLGIYASSNTTSSVSSGTIDARSLSIRGMGVASIGYSAGEIIVSVPSGGGGLTNVRVSAGTTSNLLSAITFADSNGVSFGLDASTLTASVAAQTNQTLGLYAVSNTTGQSSSSTFDARTLSFHGAGIASVGYSNGSVVVSVPSGGGGITAINVSAGTTSNNLTALTFADSNGISFGLNASTITANANTVGTATTVYSVASANSVGTVTRWAAEDHRHAGVGGIGISTEGNTAGTSGSQLGTYWLQGGNAITISQITSNNGSHTAIISGPGHATLSMWPYPLPGSTALSTYYSASTSQGAGGGSTRTGYTFSLYAVPLALPAALAMSELRIGVSNQSVVGTGSATHMYSVGIYSNNASTLSLVQPFYGGIVVSQNSQTAQTFSVFTATTAGATSGAGGGMAGISKHSVYSSQGNISANSQIFGRLHFIRVDSGAAITLTAGQYYMIFGNATASSGANVLSQVGVIQSNAISSAGIPDLGRENNTQFSNYLGAWGAISTTFSSNSNAAQFFPLPGSIAISDMTLSQSSAQRFHFPVMRNHS